MISTSAGFQMPFAMNGAPEVRRQMLQWQNDDTDGGALTDTLTAPQKHWNWWDTINLSNIHVLGTVSPSPLAMTCLVETKTR